MIASNVVTSTCNGRNNRRYSTNRKQYFKLHIYNNPRGRSILNYLFNLCLICFSIVVVVFLAPQARGNTIETCCMNTFYFFHPARRDGSQVLTREQETANTSLSFMMICFRFTYCIGFSIFLFAISCWPCPWGPEREVRFRSFPQKGHQVPTVRIIGDMQRL